MDKFRRSKCKNNRLSLTLLKGNMIPKFREPVKPGEILLKEFLIPMEISQVALAEKMGVPVQRVNTLINGRRDMTAETAVLLSYVLGTSTQFWMNLQAACDIYKAEKSLKQPAGSKTALKRPFKKINTVKN